MSPQGIRVPWMRLPVVHDTARARVDVVANHVISDSLVTNSSLDLLDASKAFRVISNGLTFLASRIAAFHQQGGGCVFILSAGLCDQLVPDLLWLAEIFALDDPVARLGDGVEDLASRRGMVVVPLPLLALTERFLSDGGVIARVLGGLLIPSTWPHRPVPWNSRLILRCQS